MERYRPASCDPPRVRPWTRSSFSLPANSFLRIFNDDAALEQLRADLIRSLEVLRFTRLIPLCDQSVDLRFGDSAFVNRRLQHIEDRIEFVKQSSRGDKIRDLEIPGVHRRISFADIFEYRSQRLGRIQVIVEARFEAFL